MKCNVLKLLALGFVMLLLASCGKTAQVSELNIVPEPVRLEQKSGVFTVKTLLKLRMENLSQNSQTFGYVKSSLRKLGFRPSFVSGNTQGDFLFELNKEYDGEIGDEGYVLDVTSDGITVRANTETGLFYGYQTFLQMLPDDVCRTAYSKVSIPACSIVDYPRFTWRGSHLDVCRHFFPMSQIKKHLDIMAAYKMNRFHWHLTEDQGWRLEISKYPLLTEVGAWRVDRNDEDWNYPRNPEPGEKATYGGFFSKEDVKEIVEYAAQRHIEVIPEIEFPGHCCAVLASYPELGCRDTQYCVAVADYWPPEAIMCAGNDKVQEFLRDVFDEVVEMFPFQYIHVGGDEAVKKHWETCPKCQARIKELQLNNEAELQSWLTAEIEKYLLEKGKRIIGWDEILEGFVTPSCTVMSWRGTEGGIAAARKGNDVIMTPVSPCYFDYRQADSLYQPQAIGKAFRFNPLSRVYQFNPTPVELNAEEQKHILGGQCNLWTEYIKDNEHLEYMLLPRLCAMSECLWSPLDRKSWERFQVKIEHHKDRIAAMGYNLCWGSFKPMVTTMPDAEGTRVSLAAEELGTVFHYTIDGSDPTLESPTYAEPLILKPGAMLKTLAEYRGQKREGVYSFSF
ncbi:MAG: family 20 glycosylhydrolase [Bacteroidales bacterium]|nr:family 20 glycosylhydrolase [Bacteroidales bacterium]